MGRYGNIDGIATLTNNPNATDNAKGTIGKKTFFGHDFESEPIHTEITADDVVEVIEEFFFQNE